MSEIVDEISPKKRYVLSMLELIEKDPEIAALTPSEEVRISSEKAGLSVEQRVDAILEGYAERPALGMRRYEIVEDKATGKNIRNYLPAYSTITYSILQSRSRAIASAWRHHPDHKVDVDDMVCIMGFASSDFQVLDLACLYAQAVTVPLQSATSGADLTDIFTNVAPVTLATTVTDLPVCTEHAIEHGGMRSLVVFDYDHRDCNDREAFENAGAALEKAGVKTRLITFDELLEYGQSFQWEPLPSHPEGEQRMAAIIHSSGSTGTPKGAIISEAANRLNWAAPEKAFPMSTVCFAPLNHLLGRNTTLFALRTGGTVYFTLAPDMSTLFEDIRITRPTYMSFFPRVFDLIYQHYQNEVASRVKTGEGSEEEISEIVKKEMGASYLGDRLRAGLVGGAPTAQKVMDFIRDCFGILLNEGYGNTESGTGSVALDGKILRPPVLEYKLRDVPELGYYTTDKPYPRGELLYKSSVQITQYYKQPDATAGLLDEDGFSCTGDIVEEHGPDHVVVIDRRKDVLKLSQGEYVAVGNLGAMFEGGSAATKQIYVYGNSQQAYLVAVVVPDEEIATARLGEGYTDAQLKNLIRDEMQRVAAKEGLKSFEVPRDFIIERELFGQENGLLSSIRKKLRPALKRKYGERLEALYQEQQQRQEEELKALKDPGSPLSTLEKVGKLLEVNLRVQGIDLSQPKTFAELGGDSLGAVLFSLSIEEVFGVSLPADTILSPTGNPEKWAQLIEQQLSGGGDRPTFAKIHGEGATSIGADDLQLSKFLGDDLIERAAAALEPSEDVKTVLLTGGNGFLGHIVCLEWLEKLAPRGGKLVCLVRAADNAAARQRLDQAFEGVDPAFEKRYHELAENHLEVLAGDAGDEKLGLSEEDFERLSGEVDRISHVAALVNHRFAYEHLFGPNVVGTAEIIRLALTIRKKPIDFVSTVGVYPLLDASEGLIEDAPLRAKIKLLDYYAAGYAASKWASEHLLLKANRQFGLPVNNFRGDMMLPHRVYEGQFNIADNFTRLLYSVIKTGLAPQSFYEPAPDGGNANGHYDGLPVDVVAATVAGVDDNLVDQYRNYNIENYHHDDGCSLDAFVDWIEAAGYPITRIEHHGEWFQRFTERLKALPDQEKQQSVLEVRGAFANPQRVGAGNVGCDNFKALVKTLEVGPEVPHLSQDYINKFLEDMCLLGMIEPPRKTTAA